MFNYDVTALDRVLHALQSVRPMQIDMAYWRKTPLGYTFDQTVACAGGWVCLLGTFASDGLQLIAANPTSEWGFIPMIKGKYKEALAGYAAVGYILQTQKNNDTAEQYGRAIFSITGRGVFDKSLGIMPITDGKIAVQRRIAFAKAQQGAGVDPMILKAA